MDFLGICLSIVLGSGLLLALVRGVGVPIRDIEEACAKLREVGEDAPIRWRVRAALLRGGYVWRSKAYNGAGLYSYENLHLTPKGCSAARAYRRWGGAND